MIYKHKFKIRAPLAKVAAFHRRAHSMAAITPPPIITQMHQAPDSLDEGDEMTFTLWLGPLPIRWQARIEQCSSQGFVDRQLHGPFSKWVHRHTFQAVDSTHTFVQDEIEAAFSDHWGWKIVGMGMWFSLPLLFAFRGWKTRRLLEEA